MNVAIQLSTVAITVCLLSDTSFAELAKDQAQSLYQAAIADPFDDHVFTLYLATLPKVYLPLGSDQPLYVVEGDVPRSADEVRQYLASEVTAPETIPDTGLELRVHAIGGKLQLWHSTTDRKLNYAIIKSSFASNEFTQILNDLEIVAQDWEATCPECGIDFEHKGEFDRITLRDEFEEATANDSIRFIVLKTNSKGEYLATAFFPNENWDRRIVSIDASLFEHRFASKRRGILRHVLGHILGYRHERIRGIAGCYRKNNFWLPLTQYDSHSVMHYYCNGLEPPSLELTEGDRISHKRVYLAQ